MSGYAIPVFLPRRRKIVTPAEWLREKVREQKAERERAISLAIGTPTQVGSDQTSATSGQTQMQINIGTGVSAGDTVAYMAHYGNNGTPVGDLSSVVDDHSNNYAMGISSFEPVGTICYVCVWFFYYASAPGQTTITATLPASANMTFSRAFKVSGLAPSSAKDRDGVGNSRTTTLTVTASGATGQADEIILYVSGSAGSGTAPTWPQDTLTALGSPQTNGTRSSTAEYGYEILSAIGTPGPYDSTFQTGTNRTAGCFVTLKASSVQPQTLRPDADTADGGWTTTPLWSKVDEESAGGDVITGTAS